jgi:hypothetical protein
MKIWVLWQGRAEDDSDLIGAYTTKELATAAMEAVYKERYKEEFDLIMLGNAEEGKVMVHPDSMEIDMIDEYFDQFDSECWIDDIELVGEINADI